MGSQNTAHVLKPLDAQTFFKRQFGHAPTHVVKAPGRLELLGNHTDYNHGLVLALAIDRYIHVASSPRNDGKIELASSAFPGREKFWISEFTPRTGAPWADYVKGVLSALRGRGVHFGGFSAAVHSTLPMGAGLGSSGALEVAAALTVRRLYPHRLTESGATRLHTRGAKDELPPLTPQEKLRIAKLCQQAENEFVGVHSGLLDQLSSLFGAEFHAMQIDFEHLTVELHPLIGELAVVVCDSGVQHELAASSYNELRFLCESAAHKLGVRSLRVVEPKFLSAHKRKLSQREFECAYHIVGENHRVVFAERALRAGDLEQLGQYLFQSHLSSRDFFRNSCPELDLLVEMARNQPACLGARLTGAGFGGATVNLVAWSQAEEFMKKMSARYAKLTGERLTTMRCRVVDGAG